MLIALIFPVKQGWIQTLTKGDAKMRRAAQWQSHCHSCFAVVGVDCPLMHEARKLEQLGYSVILKYNDYYDHVTGLC